ncbi:hypothetical protein [Zobellia uliginosa]|uniref:hypothetical protein n=1 Tax=Zobellia uliginosa TaxID=143224 RepID=UPI001C06AD68|nr:hypothetical protein [Zobellia uliginosa]MBU2948216.1 hypothetical protein [Zobellia uliginosa]
MKNVFTILVTLFCISTLLAQKVKVKKDKILVDGTEVGIIEAIDKKEIKYAIKDLAGAELFEVDVDIAPGSTRPFEYNWMTISSKDYEQVNVVDYSMISMSLSHAKIIAEILTKTYFIFSAEGINKEMIADFFAEQRTSKYKEDATGAGGLDMANQGEGFNGKVKVKKGEILFDKNAVAQLKNVGDGLYVFSALDGSEKLNVKYFSLYIDQVFDKKWLEITDSKNRMAEVKMEYVSTWSGLNLEKGITELLAKKYNLITESGIENLDVFYAVDRIKLSDGFLEEYNTIQAERMERVKNVEARLAQFRVNEAGKISMSNDGSNAGYFTTNGKPIQATGGIRNLMALADVNDKVIAKFEGVDASNYKVTTFDKKQYEFNSKTFRPDGNEKEFFEEALLFIIIAGYDDALEYSIQGSLNNQREIAADKYEEDKANSSNIYNNKGYVIDKDGKKWEGTLTIEFEKFENPNAASQGGNIVNIDGGETKYGKEVVVRYLNEKGKTRSRKFNSKNQEVVVIYNEDGSETKYEGIKISPDDALDVIGTSGNLSFNYSGFYEILSEDETAKILRNPKYDELGIKLKKEEKGYFFKGKLQTKRAEKLLKYLSACSDLPIEIKKLEFSKISEVEELLKYYKTSCN